MRRDEAKVFLDSGAFSAWSKGVEIDLPAYCRYIQDNADIIRVEDDAVVASVLDSIGDDLGTYKNQMRMEKLGVRPLPCFHYGEDPRYLQLYAANYSYITLGGMVAQSTKDLLIWLDEIWEKYLTDGAGRPITKVHAFGVTTPILMKKYPWFSVDSSSWVQVAANGSILFNGKAMAISAESPNRKVQNQHYDTFTDLQREAIDKRLTSQGYTTEDLMHKYLSRWIYNINAYVEMHKEYPPFEDAIFKQTQFGLF
ncbi:MAG: hypothetical protein JKY62_16680 [Desulfocapsa sp.]|nr:hypothetical protein [Desulfocapsa sp.]